MKAWQKLFSDKTLDESIELVDDLKIISNDGVEIIAEIEGFKVKTYLSYNSPFFPSCNCPQKSPCKHEATLFYYFEKYVDLFSKESDVTEIIKNITEKQLKTFLLNEIKSNDNLKNKFLDEFQTKSLIDKDYYRNKLSQVFKRGEDDMFAYHGMYNLDLMESDLYDFLMNDISIILDAGEYDFTCDLLCRIGELLNDEIISTFDSWYNLADRFMEYVNVLSSSIHLNSDKLDELYSKTYNISDWM